MTSKPQPVAVETPNVGEEAYEEQNVHQVYEEIATHFSDTRYKVRNGKSQVLKILKQPFL
jgi:tRNA (uracil-5-)-methyltransferase TRM9